MRYRLRTGSSRRCRRSCTPRTAAAGAVIVEAAYVLPLLLVLLIGAFWMARAYNIYETITRAAREGARAAVVRTCSSCGNSLPTVANVENAVLNSLTASSLDTTKVAITPPTCSGINLSSKICYVRDVVLNSGDSPTELGVVVSFSYPFQFNLPFTQLNLTTLTISTEVQMREEN